MRKLTSSVVPCSRFRPSRNTFRTSTRFSRASRPMTSSFRPTRVSPCVGMRSSATVSSLAVPCSLRLEVVALESGAQEGQGKSRSPLVVSARSQTDSSRPEGSFRYQPWSDLSASNQSFRAGSNAALVRDLSRERRGRPRGVPRFLRGLVVRFVVGDHDSRRDCQPGGRHAVSRERSLCASCRDCRAPLGSGCWRRLSSVETRRVHSRRRDRPVKVS